MDDLYGDLENYNEVNIVEELRNENKDLKLKLEEYETAMGKLQKDYDKLTLEFHNLQLNYSSLLKTARAEVVRKAEMITQLNLANDMKVLETLQRGTNRRTSGNKNRHENFNKSANTHSSKDAKYDQRPKTDSQKNERCHVSSVSMSTNVHSNNTKLNIIDKVIDRVDESIYRGGLKEKEKASGYDSKYKDPPNTSTRRKSVNSDVAPKFSSDDESEQEKKHKIRNNIPPSDNSVTSNVDRVLARSSNERISMKTSDTSSMDGRSLNYHEEARDSNRSRNNRYDNERSRESNRHRGSGNHKSSERNRENDNNKDCDRGKVINDKPTDSYRELNNFSGRDKFETSHKYRKRYSPNRPYKRSYREYHDDSYRTEYGRRKQERSHNENYGRYRQKSPEHQRQFDRDCYRPPYEEGHVGRSYDESNKRQKLEPKISSENKRQASSTVVMSAGDDLAYDMLYTSCQSPDLSHPPETHTEAVPTHTIKEIKTTATMPLDDPRVTSNKYILGNENDATFLYTVSSQNINIKPIDKSLWNIKSFALPDALLHCPLSDFTEENIKEIYKSIRNSDSYESGEISNESQDIVHSHNRQTISEKKEGAEFTNDTTLMRHEQKSRIQHARKKSTSVENHETNKVEEISYASKNTDDKENGAKNTLKCPDLSENISEILLKVNPSKQKNISTLPLQDKPSEEHVKTDPVTDMSVDNHAVGPDEIFNSSELTDADLSKNSTEILSNYNLKDGHIKQVSKTYRIPKLKQGERNVSDIYKGLPKNEHEDINIHKTICVRQDVEVPPQNLPHIDVNDDVIPSRVLNEKHSCKISDKNSKLISDIAMVQDDLELSDETSDNLLEMHNKVPGQEKSQPHQDINLTHAKPEILCEPKCDSITVNKKEDIQKDTEGQKKKPKKKKVKSKESELGEIADNISTDKKRCKKDSIPKQIKNKFSDLFGDSSSLITPEDLGIPIPTSSVPFCDDGQNAVDINIKTITRAPITESVIEESCSSGNISNKETTNNRDLKNSNIDDKELPKNLEEQIKSSQLDTNIVYQNINYDTTDKLDVVKTVIISSGVQPQLILDNENSTIEKKIADVEVNIQSIANSHLSAEFQNQDSINALATSTPFKNLCLTKKFDDTSENSCTSNNNKVSEEIVDKAQGSNPNTLNHIDPPDVRIFVRRRRKISRKT